MGFTELFVLAVGVSMDAFAVSVCKGLSLGKARVKHMCIAGAWFGGFQALMPLVGYYFFGAFFTSRITRYSHWIAFFLLLWMGVKMIKDAWAEDSSAVSGEMDVKSMFTLAVATSIDALTVGVTFAFLEVKAVPASAFIGCVTFIFSAVGVKAGSLFGAKYKSKAELCGGMILILLGGKILLEGLGIW